MLQITPSIVQLIAPIKFFEIPIKNSEDINIVELSPNLITQIKSSYNFMNFPSDNPIKSFDNFINITFDLITFLTDDSIKISERKTPLMFQPLTPKKVVITQ